jgi:acyl-[acyl-carrier-protein]-phospholipid O-acyltransferase/long-chain-fatty-acid--[acyl-carrier-protein] ligase
VHSTIARQWHFKLLLNFIDYVVVDASSPLAMTAMVHAIEGGKPVVIFPEGRISVTGSLMKVYDGPAFLAAKTGAELLPVYIEGASNSYYGRTKPPFPRKLRPEVTLTFMAPRRIEMPEARTGRERRRLASESLRYLMEEMCFQAQPRKPIFESFLDAIDMYGRSWPLLEDINMQPANYGKVLKGALALGRISCKMTTEQEAVGVLLPNAIPAVCLVLGLMAFRRIPALMNFTSGVDGMQSAIETAKIKLLLTSRTFLEKGKLTDKVAQLRGVKVVYLEDARAMLTLGDKLWLILYAMRMPRSAVPESKIDEPAVILFTSGSEGRPKGVVLSHRSITSNIAQIRSVIEFSNRDKFFVALPMFHSFGLTAGTLLPVLNGVPVFLYPSPLHYRIVPELTYDRDCTVLFGTPTFLGNYARFANPYDFYSVRYVVAGAEKLSKEVRATYADKFGLRILEGYGATECAPVLCVNTPTFYQEGTVGRLMPAMEYKLEPVAGLQTGKVLHVRGPNLMLGYLLYDNPGVLVPPESIYGKGWYNTGDVVDIDSRGFVKILERVKRFAKVGGEMVSLEVVERIAAEAAKGKSHAATMVADGKRGETIVLFTESPDLKRDQLVDVAKSMGLPEVAVARKIIYIDKIPRLGSGKFDYPSIKTMAAQQQSAVNN